jgi:hypothetical protein
MTDNPERYRRAVDRFDAANRQDPNRTRLGGVEYPDELLYAQRMTQWLERLEPDASEALRLAVRCQHLCRWMIPRGQFPMTRAGYHAWRTTLARFHAEKAGEILRGEGYDEPAVARVQSLVRKERLKSDAEAQTLEDVACLVFLENEFAEFAARHDEAKVINIVARTWRKMSDRGHAAALGLDLPADARRLIGKALGPPPPGAPEEPPGPGDGSP